MTRTEKFFKEFLEDPWRKEKAAAFGRLRAYVLERGLLGMAGFAYQGQEKLGGKRRDWYSFFDRKFGITMSMRSWGRFMAALMNDELGKRRFDYVDFAWISPETKIPKQRFEELASLKKSQMQGECGDCGQPLGDHCEGCCIDFMAGVHKGKFCGKKGNEIGIQLAKKKKNKSKITRKTGG